MTTAAAAAAGGIHGGRLGAAGAGGGGRVSSHGVCGSCSCRRGRCVLLAVHGGVVVAMLCMVSCCCILEQLQAAAERWWHLQFTTNSRGASFLKPASPQATTKFCMYRTSSSHRCQTRNWL
jgi:hypothetical protein